mmetsp:Transcript_13040/g.20494  ORF Transcript_13040/g.20494 Transcript_13040/m.20494 type:complete len:112 (+) Transcript_13040:618-953(+)
MTLGKHETIGGHELSRELRVCLYEEYVAATHNLQKELGRVNKHGLMGGTITRILPGNFSCEVQWDDGTKGVYFQSALFCGVDVPRAQVNFPTGAKSKKSSSRPKSGNSVRR